MRLPMSLINCQSKFNFDRKSSSAQLEGISRVWRTSANSGYKDIFSRAINSRYYTVFVLLPLGGERKLTIFRVIPVDSGLSISNGIFLVKSFFFWERELMETKATVINVKTKFDIQRTVHRVIYSYNKKPTRCTISQLYLVKKSTCFGQTYHLQPDIATRQSTSLTYSLHGAKSFLRS